MISYIPDIVPETPLCIIHTRYSAPYAPPYIIHTRDSVPCTSPSKRGVYGTLYLVYVKRRVWYTAIPGMNDLIHYSNEKGVVYGVLLCLVCTMIPVSNTIENEKRRFWCCSFSMILYIPGTVYQYLLSFSMAYAIVHTPEYQVQDSTWYQVLRSMSYTPLFIFNSVRYRAYQVYHTRLFSFSIVHFVVHTRHSRIP